MTHALVSNPPFLSFTYTHDKVGQLATADEGTALGVHGYAYDPYRLVGEAITSTIATNLSNTWSLDAATHITRATSRPTGGGGVPITNTYSYNSTASPYQLSRLVEQQGDPAVSTKWLNFTYDNKGNRTLQNPFGGLGHIVGYTYDQANRLTKYQMDSGTVWTYGYNGDGLRTSKSNNSPGTTEYFTWDIAAGLPLLLQDGSASFVYGPGGMPLEEVVNSDGKTYYYHADQLGSVRALTDANGSVVNTYNYDAYGNIASSTGTTYNRFGYTGEYTDGESGLVYLRARYYDPSTQQFLSIDPLVGMTGQAYAYASGSPQHFTDPLGLDNLTEKCKRTAEKIKNLKISIERSARNLFENKGDNGVPWPSNDPRRITHIERHEDLQRKLKNKEEQYASECCGIDPEPQPEEAPAVIPNTQSSSEPQSGAAFAPLGPIPVPVPAPIPVGARGFGGEDGVCDALVKTAVVTAGAAGTAAIIDVLIGAGIIVLVVP